MRSTTARPYRVCHARFNGEVEQPPGLVQLAGTAVQLHDGGVRARIWRRHLVQDRDRGSAVAALHVCIQQRIVGHGPQLHAARLGRRHRRLHRTDVALARLREIKDMVRAEYKRARGPP